MITRVSRDADDPSFGDDLRAAQNRELSKADQKLGIYLYDRDGRGSMMFQHRVQRVIEFEELDAYRNIHVARIHVQ
jgi:hypothetical protein